MDESCDDQKSLQHLDSARSVMTRVDLAGSLGSHARRNCEWFPEVSVSATSTLTKSINISDVYIIVESFALLLALRFPDFMLRSTVSAVRSRTEQGLSVPE